MNQVYFYKTKKPTKDAIEKIGLNPFMNQVYFYQPDILEDAHSGANQS